jgi:hypothetical protein
VLCAHDVDRVIVALKLEQLPGNHPLQAPPDLADTPAFSLSAGGVGASLRVVAQPCQHNGSSSGSHDQRRADWWR